MFNNRIGSIKYLIATDAVSVYTLGILVYFCIDWNGIEFEYKKNYFFNNN